MDRSGQGSRLIVERQAKLGASRVQPSSDRRRLEVERCPDLLAGITAELGEREDLTAFGGKVLEEFTKQTRSEVTFGFALVATSADGELAKFAVSSATSRQAASVVVHDIAENRYQPRSTSVSLAKLEFVEPAKCHQEGLLHEIVDVGIRRSKTPSAFPDEIMVAPK